MTEPQYESICINFWMIASKKYFKNTCLRVYIPYKRSFVLKNISCNHFDFHCRFVDLFEKHFFPEIFLL